MSSTTRTRPVFLEEVDLCPSARDRYPHEFSGGQRQRLAIAGALISDHEFVLLDEPASALDVSALAQVLNLLFDRRDRRGPSYVLDSNELVVVRLVVDRLLVLHERRIVERGPASEVLIAESIPTPSRWVPRTSRESSRWRRLGCPPHGLSSPSQMSGVEASIATIERMIHSVRGCRVMLDHDLAALYCTTTKRLNEQVRRNARRFPKDFMFRLTSSEWRILRSQIATSNVGHGGRRYPPYVFTEHGAVMLANVLNSERAIDASLAVVRTFIRLRAMLVSHTDLSRRIDALEAKYDGQFREVFTVLRQLIVGPSTSRERIGFEPPIDR